MTLKTRQTISLTIRALLALWRQPWFVAITLVQPMIWLLLFGALFKHVVDIPGFHGGTYLHFLTPGVVVMSALFAAGWNGMGLIEAIDRGIMDRFLVTPVWRGALVGASCVHAAVVIFVQTLVIVAVAFVAGTTFSMTTVGVMLVLPLLLGSAVAALSNALALVTRQEESLIGVVQFVVLPASFLSSGMMAFNLMPQWVQDIARFNPVNWTVAATRSAQWALIGEHAGLLLALMLACGWVATRAFRVYQRAV
jgi:ABC-2 type transport system permease protein